LALAFAVAQPERAASLALIDAHVSHAGWGSAMAATLGLEGAARDRKIVENFQSWLGRHSARKRTKLAENAKGLVYGTSLVSDIAASPPLAEVALRRLATPTLCLYGAQSDVRERGEWLARTLPRARLQLVAGATHSVLWEATETVKAALLGWLEEQEEERS
jgi:pimeloyl-ACP methyl ester carboxylesterase